MALGEVAARLSLSPKPVDVAAGLLLIEKIGGVTTDLTGNAFDLDGRTFLAAASPGIHGKLLAALHGV